MELLQASPESLRAVYIDSDSDPKNIILAIAVRHVAVAEMTVPRVKYDPWKMITILDGGGALTMLQHISTYLEGLFESLEWVKEIRAAAPEEKFEQAVEEADETIAEEVN